MKRVGLQLEKSTFVYAYAAPSIEAGLGNTLRLPDRCNKEVIYKAICDGWQIAGRSNDLKTCGLFIPSGLVSVDAGMSYSVNYKRVSCLDPWVKSIPRLLELLTSRKQLKVFRGSKLIDP